MFDAVNAAHGTSLYDVTYAGRIYESTYYDVEILVTDKPLAMALDKVEAARSLVKEREPRWREISEPRIKARHGRAYVVIEYASDEGL